MPETWQTRGFGLYLHWPFCQAKCPYCDFNSHVAARIDQARWRDAYAAEIRRTAAETPGRVLGSVYFGGGTPSLMSPELVGAVLETVSACWTLSNNVEVTLEANPSSVEANRFAGYRAAGVNRVSIGVQALNDADLRALGRLHSVSDALQALKVARSTFDRISFDLIYARQRQDLGGWRAELGKALDLAEGHLSLYQLTIEDGTAFGDRHRRGRLPGLPRDEIAADMYQLTQEMCDGAGLPAYEISNHAASGNESRHNLIYWRGGDYVGIGPGAHGRLTLGGGRLATETLLSPSDWLAAVESSGSGETVRAVLAPAEQAEELLMMGLRTAEGISLDDLDPAALGSHAIRKARQLSEDGYVTLRDGRLSVTPPGRLLLNAILRELLAGQP